MALSSLKRQVLSQYVDRDLAPHIPLSHYAVLRFVFDRTISWGKTQEVIRSSHLTDGVPGIREGLPIGRTLALAALKNLTDMGILICEDGAWGNSYSINFDWTTDMLKVPRNKRKMEEGSTESVRGGFNICMGGSTESVPILKVKRSNSNIVNVNNRENTPIDQKQLIVNAQQKSKKSAEKKAAKLKGENSLRAVAATWSAAMLEHYPSHPQMEWSKRMYGTAKPLLALSFANGDVQEWLTWVIGNWEVLRWQKFKWLMEDNQGGFPAVPRLPFVVGHRAGFLEAWGDKEEIARQHARPQAEVAIERMMKKGMSYDEAVAELERVKEAGKPKAVKKKAPWQMRTRPLPKPLPKLQPVAIIPEGETVKIPRLKGGSFE